MATQLADIATLDQGGGPSVIEQGLKDARVKANLDSYELTTATTSGSTLDIGAALPKNARIIAIGLHVDTAQTSLTFKLGDDADDDRYVAAGKNSLQTADTLHWFSGKNYKTGQTSGDQQMLITTGGATATAGQLEVVILYTVD